MILGEPVDPLRCAREDCSLPDGGSCARSAEFSDPHAACPELVRIANRRPTPSAPIETRADGKLGPLEGDPAPWSGEALLPEDMRRFLGRSHPRIIAVMGDSAAGKTSLVTSFLLQLADGRREGFPYRFASSLSLKGIGDLTREAARWSGDDKANVVPRTPPNTGARFVHLGLRPENERDDRHLDLLISDIDGETMKAHASHATEQTRAVMNFVLRADAVLVVADAGLLMTDEGVDHERETARQFGRILSDLSKASVRPCVGLVFAKFDRVIHRVRPPSVRRGEANAWGELERSSRSIWRCVEQARREGMHVDVFSVSAFPRRLQEGQPVNVMAPFAFAMCHADTRESLGVPWSLPATGCSSFEAMRRWRD